MIILNEYELDHLRDPKVFTQLTPQDSQYLFLIMKYPKFRFYKGTWGPEILRAGFGGYNFGWGAWADVTEDRAYEILTHIWNHSLKYERIGPS